MSGGNLGNVVSTNFDRDNMIYFLYKIIFVLHIYAENNQDIKSITIVKK